MYVVHLAHTGGAFIEWCFHSWETRTETLLIALMVPRHGALSATL